MLLLRSQSGRFRGQDFVIWPNTFYRRSVCHAKALKFQLSVDSSCCSDLSSSVSSQPLRRHHSRLFQASVSKTKGDSKQLVGSGGVKKRGVWIGWCNDPTRTSLVFALTSLSRRLLLRHILRTESLEQVMTI